MSSSLSTPLKSNLKKKAVQSVQSPNPLSSLKTPDKQPAPLPRRGRNHGVALSIKEIRQIAQTRSRHNPTDQVKPVRRQIASWPDETPSVVKPKRTIDESAKLPPKYEMLAEFFDCLDSSIRLLRLKGSMTTFTNIFPKIECLTDRRFSRGHLAQLKYILPEAIEIKRVLKFDERTSCMKPDLHVSVNVDAMEFDEKSKESRNIELRKIFRGRLLDFYKAHPEGKDIPEATLPEPFNQSKQVLNSDITRPHTLSLSTETSRSPNELTDPGSASSVVTSTEAPEIQQSSVASHLTRSFRRHFSQMVSKKDKEKTGLKSSKVSIPDPVSLAREPCFSKISSSIEIDDSGTTSTLNILSKSTGSGISSEVCDSPACLPSSFVSATPKKAIDLKKNDGSIAKVDDNQSTPAKFASTPARLMTATPTLQPPKRCYMSPDDDSICSQDKLVRRPPRTRSLKFDTPVKNEKLEEQINDIESISVVDDIHDILPESLLQSIREKERKVTEERDPAISQAKRRRQMIACLPKLFNMIHFLFQSIGRSVITKEELMHKIIANPCDIVDRREVEEQLKLLLELAPEWITEKLASSGDLLVRINKMSNSELIRSRLEEAK
ncbi:CDT1-like protein a chloroplastic [Tripterygium wilfordii]|uniref:CDT1-like protein a chloroplastic n=1 Tax=Tripterygium wilfordii TaxID=458696 RepID=A0A7J7CXY0_TRIWF|nr:CDT1-like protein a, chloroplastic [Tripterygium wilfordii]KAF5738920.1 CDT1-like protein a chloroplastic [Tripterygium wilfordii]